jgi:hypothetical protein
MQMSLVGGQSLQVGGENDATMVQVGLHTCVRRIEEGGAVSYHHCAAISPAGSRESFH